MRFLPKVWFGRSAFLGTRSGSAAIEFAILAPLFFLIVFAIFEIALLFTAELVLDKATAYAGRQVRVGEIQQSRMTKDEFKQLTCDRVKFLMDCDKLSFDLRSYPSFEDVPTTIPRAGNTIDTSGFRYELSRGGTIVALRVFYKWPVITGMMRRFFASTNDGATILMSLTTFRTEPF